MLLTIGAGLGPSACGGLEQRTEVVDVGVEQLEPIAPGMRFRDVREIAMSGSVAWVLDAEPPHLGRIPMGDANEGSTVLELPPVPPGSRSDPRALQVSDGTVEIWDFAAQRRITYDRPSDSFVVSTLSSERRDAVRPDMAEVSHVDPWRVRLFGTGVVGLAFPRPVSDPLELATGTISLMTRDLAHSAAVLSFVDQMPRDARAAGQFPWVPLWEVCAGEIVTWNARSSSVVWWDSAGTVRESVPVPLESGTPSREHVASFLTAMAAHEGTDVPPSAIDARAREVRPLFATPVPPVVDMICDASAGVWLRLFDLDDDPLGRGRTWLRVDRSGPGELVRFPIGFRPFAFREGATLGVLTGPDFDGLAVWRTSPP